MDKDKLFDLLRRGLKSFADDVYLLEHNVAERSITAKLGCHMQVHLPAVVGAEVYWELKSAERLHVDCEFNRHGDDTKWIPWETPIVDPQKKTIYYNPSPDIILHRRGREGPNVLVVEAKKEGEADNLAILLDKLKLVGYVGPNLSYHYGLYLCLGHDKERPVVVAAELIDRKAVQEAINSNSKALWNHCRQLIEKGVQPCGRVSIRQHLGAAQDKDAGELCLAVEKQFSFTDVADRFKD